MPEIEVQETKAEFITTDGITIPIRSFSNIKISQALHKKVKDFSIDSSIFEDELYQKVTAGSRFNVYRDDVLFFKGFVSETPRSLDGIQKNYSFSGTDLLGKTQYIIVNESFEKMNLSDIVMYLCNKYIPEIPIAFIQPSDFSLSISFKDTFLYNAFEKLAETFNFTFFLDDEEQFHFLNQEERTNQETIGNGDYIKGSANFSFETSRLVNSVTAYGGNNLSPDIVQKIKGDGLNSTFLLNYKPYATLQYDRIIVKLNGVEQQLGIRGLNDNDKNIDCYVNFNEKSLRFLNRGLGTDKILQVGDLVEANYRYANKLITKLKDNDSILKYGLREDILNFKDITDKNALIEKTRTHLSKYCNPILTGALTTYKNTWNCGEVVLVDITSEDKTFINEFLQITQKDINIVPNDIRISLKFEQKKDLSQVMKEILERLRELEKEQSKDEVIQQIDVFSDTVNFIEKNTLHSIPDHVVRKGFIIGYTRIGGTL